MMAITQSERSMALRTTTEGCCAWDAGAKSRRGTYTSIPCAAARVCKRQASACSAGSRLWLRKTRNPIPPIILSPGSSYFKHAFSPSRLTLDDLLFFIRNPVKLVNQLVDLLISCSDLALQAVELRGREFARMLLLIQFQHPLDQRHHAVVPRLVVSGPLADLLGAFHPALSTFLAHFGLPA